LEPWTRQVESTASWWTEQQEPWNHCANLYLFLHKVGSRPPGTVVEPWNRGWFQVPAGFQHDWNLVQRSVSAA
jgi:hypothetical protein